VKIMNTYAARTGRDPSIFAKEMRNEKYMSIERAINLGVIDCLAGEEIWRNNRPYAFPRGDYGSSVFASRQGEFSQYRQTIARAFHNGARGQIFGHVALTRAGGFDGDWNKLLRTA
jgi:hypothetical protein